ncbi:unnamed protein product [Mytilus coruscus]|uniref:Fucolectin tachylectin-4 pentraxin-1 domain-containing protein n=1 Tax=Mytilus coruscus TaxID=42192 RepID=A0A6J8DSF8_MYTCO|nr:unnamed protein product [Mytilus coruscus]
MREISDGIICIFATLYFLPDFGKGYRNIALNKNATQVSTRLNNFTYFGAKNANDGKRNQFAPNGDCMHTNDTDPEKWWTIDFGNMYTIESVSIYGRKFCCFERHSDFEIRIHNTSDWSSQYSLCYKQIGQAPTELYVNCTDFISGKYLTVYKKNDHHNYPLTLCEVEVYGSETTVNTYIRADNSWNSKWKSHYIRIKAHNSWNYNWRLHNK